MELQLLTKDLPVSIDPLLFRRVMRRFATGVTVLTVRDGEIIHGMTANSFTSVSLSPTLVLVCILNGSTTHDFVSRAGHYAINILSHTQVDLAQRFAKQVLVPSEPFADVPYHSAVTGAPIFDECLGYIDCRVIAAHPAGDHTIFLGEVLAAGFGQAPDGPLLWLEGKYESVESP